jgi:ubiquinone/menaquinone biosynthesis C-methylase UbiE
LKVEAALMANPPDTAPTDPDFMANVHEQETQAVKTFFTDKSDDYADLFAGRRTGRHFEFGQRLQFALELTRDCEGSFFDCATGSGEITAAVLASGRFHQATVADLSPRMVELSQRRIESQLRGRPPIQLKMVNADIFKFAAENPERRFNLILCLGLIAHTGRLPELLHGLTRMLHPGGAILLQATLSDHLGVRVFRALTEKRHIRRQGYRISNFRRRDILQAAQAAGLMLAAQRRYGLCIPFGDKIWARGNYHLEKAFQGWSKSHGGEELYLLKLNPGIR